MKLKGGIRLNSVSSNQSVVSSQQGLFDAIKDLLFVNPIFFIWNNSNLRNGDYNFQEE